ncbi:MAG: T9SS type A sorting domain-containing protein, partial [Chitinophagaceae bacterium]|nr:T9SS type A sorting domain-containing protein [Chitinophagaceae bacterium]
KITTTQPGVLQLAIYTVESKIIETDKYELFKGENVLNIPGKTTLPAGLYFIQLKLGNDVYYKRLLIK